MKGLDALAQTCAPEPQETLAGSQPNFQLTDEQIAKISDMIISKLQKPAPAPAAEKPEPDQDPEEGEENHGDDE